MPKYKVLVGQHIDNHPSHTGDHVYMQGDVVDTDKDLCRLNGIGMEPKFERLHEDRAAEQKADELQVTRERVRQLETELAATKAVAQQPAPTPQQPQQRVSTPLQPQRPATRPDEEDLLDAMTVQELRDKAADEEIDLKGASKKDDLVRRIRESKGR